VFGELEEVSAEDGQESMQEYMMKKAGFDKNNLMRSIFLVVAALVVAVVLIIFVVIISKKCYHKLPESVKSGFNSIKNMLMFNSILRSLLQTFLPLCTSCFISLKYAETAGQSTAGYIFLAVLALCPIGVVIILKNQKHPLAHPKLKVKIGTLYQNVETSTKPGALFFIPMFLIRRILFASIVVLTDDPLL